MAVKRSQRKSKYVRQSFKHRKYIWESCVMPGDNMKGRPNSTHRRLGVRNFFNVHLSSDCVCRVSRSLSPSLSISCLSRIQECVFESASCTGVNIYYITLTTRNKIYFIFDTSTKVLNSTAHSHTISASISKFVWFRIFARITHQLCVQNFTPSPAYKSHKHYIAPWQPTVEYERQYVAVFVQMNL